MADEQPNLQEIAAYLGRLAALVSEGIISDEEAHRRACLRSRHMSRRSTYSLTEAIWFGASQTNSRQRCRVVSLAYSLISHFSAQNSECVDIGAHAFIVAATQALGEDIDQYLYKRASEVAETLAANTTHEQHASFLLISGLLHLEPFAVNPADTNYAQYHAERYLRWERSQVLTSRAFKNKLPHPRESLRRAESYLRAALPLLQEEELAEARVHLAFCLYCLGYFVGTGYDQEIIAHSEEAARTLSSTANPLVSARLLWLLAEYKSRSVEARLPLQIDDFGQLKDQRGAYTAVTTYVTAVRALGRIGLIEDTSQIIDIILPSLDGNVAYEKERLFLNVTRCHTLRDDPTKCMDYAGIDRPKIVGSKIKSKPQMATLIHAVLHFPDANLEELGRHRQTAEKFDLDAELDLAFAVQFGLRSRKAGSIASNIPDLVVGSMLLLASSYYREAGYLINLLNDTLQKAEPRVVSSNINPATAGTIIRIANLTFGLLDDDMIPIVRRLLTTLLALVGEDEYKIGSDAMWEIMQIVKGRAFGASLANRDNKSRSELQRAILSMIDNFSTDNSDDAVAYQEESLVMDDEILLASYISPREALPGATSSARLANLRRAYQMATGSLLKSCIVSEKASLRTSAEVASRIPPKAILISILDGAVGHNLADGYWACFIGNNVTREVAYGAADVPAYARPMVGSRHGGTLVQSNVQGYRIRDLRQSLVDDPLHRRVSPEGKSELDALGRYLHPILEILQGYAEQGYTTLYVWPHESMYLVPYALIPFANGMLSDYFQVAVVPSLECFYSRALAGSELRFAALGCGAGGLDVGLPSEPAVEDQVRAICMSLGVEPIVGDEATPSRALVELAGSRYVHIAAHGSQDVVAPDFACVYLSAADASSGRLYAYEIAQSDFTNVELVSLSACESALIRYDEADNVYGLAAAFLQSGVRSVVGALWPIAPDVAAIFFGVMYDALSSGRDRLASFTKAQARTRELHPDYRDWGGFVIWGA